MSVTRFPEGSRDPLREHLLHVSAKGNYFFRFRVPVGNTLRKILLNRNTLFGLVVLSDIGDTETALADHPADGISSVEDGTRFQGERILLFRTGRIITAEGAGTV